MPVFPNTALLDLGQVSPKFLFSEIREFLVTIGVVASDLRGLYNRPCRIVQRRIVQRVTSTGASDVRFPAEA